MAASLQQFTGLSTIKSVIPGKCSANQYDGKSELSRVRRAHVLEHRYPRAHGYALE